MTKQSKANSSLKNKLKEYFSSFLFPWVRAGSEKNNSQSLPLKKALEFKYIDPNNKGYIRVLTIDIDWNIPMEEYINRIPLPNAVIVNPENGHLQIMYLLKSKVYTENAKIMYAFRMIKTSLNIILQGDFGFTGRLQKNPLHPAWDTTWFNNDPYPLSELIDWSIKQEIKFDSHYEPDLTSRHMTIFDNLRKYAYRHSKELTYNDLESYAEYLNSLCPEFGTLIKYPLDAIELRSIVRSVWRFMQDRYTGKGGLGQFSEDDRKKSSESRIDKKYRNIHLFIEYRKMGLSFERIASILHVTQKTIKNYASALHPNSSFPNSSSPNSSNPTPTSQANSEGCASCPALPSAPYPFLTPRITNTVFHWTGGLGGFTQARGQNTS